MRYRNCVLVDPVIAQDKIPTVSLHEDGVFWPVIIFIFRFHVFLELGVVRPIGIQDTTRDGQRR